MSITVGDILRVVAIAAWLDGNINQNVFNVAVGGTGGPFDDDDVVDDMLTYVEDMYVHLTNACSNELDGSEVRVYIYDSVDDDWDEIGSAAWVWNPTIALDELPRGVAALINCKTLDPDVNGKKYIGGLTEGSVANGLLETGFATAVANFGGEWIADFTGATSGADFVPGVWSPTNTNFHAMSGTIIIPTIAAYQRRRKRGLGI